MGEALGDECRAMDVAVLLGPGINLKRSPLGGRDFEYFSEDPLLTGVLAAEWVLGLQSRDVGASLKHYAVNSQETDRMRVSADVDERTLREMYLRAFQRVVTKARPWTVMCAYNKVNGVYASQNRWLLTDVLRGEWGFDGVVVSDWGAVSDRTASVAAGLDLTMPGPADPGDRELVERVSDGRLDPALLQTAAGRVRGLVERAAARQPGEYDAEAHHELAREIAGRAIVLLKNDGGILPLAADGVNSIAVIGEFARTPRYQGGGSSQITPTRLDDALTEITAATQATVLFAPGYLTGDTATWESAAGDGESESESDQDLLAEAVALAAASDAALVFVGSTQETEGADRDGIDLSDEHRELIEQVARANPRTVVVLSNGGVLRTTPWDGSVPAILEGWLLGQAGGSAIADVLFGRVNPSGRLAETIPLKLADHPSYLDFPGENGHVRYGEGMHVGYRGFDAREQEVAYPFGFGLSYTTFEYGQASAAVTDAGIEVRVPVTNTGQRDGREVVQVYLSLPGSSVRRAPRELKAFATVAIAAGRDRRRGADHRPRRPGLLGDPAGPLGGRGRRVPLRRRRLLARPAHHRGGRGRRRRRPRAADPGIDGRRVVRRPARRRTARPGVRGGGGKRRRRTGRGSARRPGPGDVHRQLPAKPDGRLRQPADPRAAGQADRHRQRLTHAMRPPPDARHRRTASLNIQYVNSYSPRV